MKIEKYIENFRKQYWTYNFINWFCFIFSSILNSKYKWKIYSNNDHVVFLHDNEFYDITWKLDKKQIIKEWYIEIDKLEKQRYERFNNF